MIRLLSVKKGADFELCMMSFQADNTQEEYVEPRVVEVS